MSKLLTGTVCVYTPLPSFLMSVEWRVTSSRVEGNPALWLLTDMMSDRTGQPRHQQQMSAKALCECVSKKVISTSLGSLRMVMPVCVLSLCVRVFLCTFSGDIDIVTILAHKAQTSA